MSTFLYRGYNKDEQMTSGSKNFDSRALMEEHLLKEEFFEYNIYESKTRYVRNIYKNVTPKEISILCRQMSVMFFSDITLMEGALLLSEQTDNKQIKMALEEINKFMETGLTFAESMSMYNNIFSHYMLNLIKVGEVSGTLDLVFAELGDYYDEESKLRKKIKNAVSYPLALSCMMAVMITILIVKVLPMFDDLLNVMGGDMPSLTKGMISFSKFLKTNGMFFIIIIFIIVFGIITYIKSPKGEKWFDKFKMKAPGSKYINSRIIVSRISRSLSLLLRSGIQITTALKEVKEIIGNDHIEKQFSEMILKVEDGEELSVAFKDMEIFPPLFLRMVTVGEQTGRLDEMLEKSSTIFDEEVDDATRRVTGMIEPILIIILSIVIGMVLISVMLPMINIMTNIG